MTETDISITRVFDAPRERVWKEWTDPEAFAAWYGGAQVEIPVSSVAMDLREGGAWKATMLPGSDHGEINWHGEYREVSEPERLVFTLSDRPGEEFDLVTVVLTDLGDGRTEMLMEQRGGHMTPEGYERAKQGWGVFFDQMEARLAEG